jgi:hypothetical protein
MEQQVTALLAGRFRGRGKNLALAANDKKFSIALTSRSRRRMAEPASLRLQQLCLE